MERIVINIGDVFGYLTVISGPIIKSENKKNRIVITRYYECKCDCGNIINRTKSTLTRKVNQNCGCKQKITFNHGDLINNFTFVKELSSKYQPNGAEVRYVEIICPHCNNHFESSLATITRKNHVISCGCQRAIKQKEALIKKGLYHGHSREIVDGVIIKGREYQIWCGMKSRCYYPKNSRYHRYGGRGIVVCDRWKDSFINFYEDMGPRPSKNHSIDRINNDGNYEPGNCRWTTTDIQTENKTTTKGRVFVEIKPNERFGKLTAISEAEPYCLKKTGKPYRRMNVKCDCGNELICFVTDLNNGKKTACKSCNMSLAKLEKRYKGSKKK